VTGGNAIGDGIGFAVGAAVVAIGCASTTGSKQSGRSGGYAALPLQTAATAGVNGFCTKVRVNEIAISESVIALLMNKPLITFSINLHTFFGAHVQGYYWILPNPLEKEVIAPHFYLELDQNRQLKLIVLVS
jgi:hypothetical protein